MLSVSFFLLVSGIVLMRVICLIILFLCVSVDNLIIECSYSVRAVCSAVGGSIPLAFLFSFSWLG